jgi:hypothetical protein
MGTCAFRLPPSGMRYAAGEHAEQSRGGDVTSQIFPRFKMGMHCLPKRNCVRDRVSGRATAGRHAARRCEGPQDFGKEPAEYRQVFDARVTAAVGVIAVRVVKIFQRDRWGGLNAFRPSQVGRLL